MEVFLLVTVAWVFSVCLHEFGHAMVAYRGGDYTVKEKGYLTLNPIHYTHPIYSLVMPLVFLMMGGIGLPGGAVYINEHLLRSKGWRTATSLAGPATNVILIMLLCVPFWLGAMDARFAPAMAFLVRLQLCAVVFNLLPVPPLDGFQAISPWLPIDVSEKMLEHSNVFFFVLIILLWNVPAANTAFWGVIDYAYGLLGLDYQLADFGWWQYRFWKH